MITDKDKEDAKLKETSFYMEHPEGSTPEYYLGYLAACEAKNKEMKDFVRWIITKFPQGEYDLREFMSNDTFDSVYTEFLKQYKP